MSRPVFEQTTSPLYTSNDGRVRLNDWSFDEAEYTVLFNSSPDFDRHGVYEGEEVLRTSNRVLVDAYIAGYDHGHAQGGVEAGWAASEDADFERETLTHDEQALLDAAAQAAPQIEAAAGEIARERTQRRYQIVSPRCTGYVDEDGHLAHDGPVCPVHEGS